MTQNEALLKELKQRGQTGITSLEALEAIGTMRLAARVHDLRKQGHPISSHRFKYNHRDKNHVALYVLQDG